MLRAKYATVRQILLDLGFVETTISQERIKFVQPDDSKTWLLFPSLQPEEQVGVGELVVVRRFLDERGLMPREQFERLLAERAVAV